MTITELRRTTVTISPNEAAARLGLKVSTLANWRWRGCGPPYLRVGSRVRYRLADLAEWLDRHARGPSSPRPDVEAPAATVS